MIVCYSQVKTGFDVEDLLNHLYECYGEVEILGITQNNKKFNVFYKIGKEKIK